MDMRFFLLNVQGMGTALMAKQTGGGGPGRGGQKQKGEWYEKAGGDGHHGGRTQSIWQKWTTKVKGGEVEEGEEFGGRKEVPKMH